MDAPRLWCIKKERKRRIMKKDFKKAIPVWPKGQTDKLNQMVGFYSSWETEDPSANSILRITAADSYRVWCNGEFLGYGPARTASGCARIDEWPMNDSIKKGKNHLAVEVISFGIDSYVYALQTPFFQAELIVEKEILLNTPNDFTTFNLDERIQKVERFSKQRPFVEAYRLNQESIKWRTGNSDKPILELEEQKSVKLLARGVRLPLFDKVYPKSCISQGPVFEKNPIPEIPGNIARDAAGVKVGGYPVSELEIDITKEINKLGFEEKSNSSQIYEKINGCSLSSFSHVQYEFGRVEGGFIGVRLSCKADTRVFLAFDEVKQRPEGKTFSLGASGIALFLDAGDYDFESIDPYSFRYLRVISMDAEITVKSVYVREYAHPKTEVYSYINDDKTLCEIFEAGRQTFRTNAIDLFTDCPSRERGGYPCDAWFTAQTERLLTGESRVEHNFLENYFLAESFFGIPEDMLPHCYPSDRIVNGNYIPNWAMWLVIQLEDYCTKNSDMELAELARIRVEKLMNYFQAYENDLALLENLPGWIFVEWSEANDYTEGINFPTNMLYAACLESAAKLYESKAWESSAKRVKKSIISESWDGHFFADQSIRVDGNLERKNIRSETCQYHAFYFNIADEDSFSDLWNFLCNDAGPLQKENPEKSQNLEDMKWIPAELLFGLMLRLELLLEKQEYEKVLEEIRHIFGKMAEQTGSLWEHDRLAASLNHGYASAACRYLADAEKGISAI